MWILAISWKKLLKLLIKDGAHIIRSKWSHFFIEYKWKYTVIPVHSNKDLPIWTLMNILRDLNISIDYIKNLIKK